MRRASGMLLLAALGLGAAPPAVPGPSAALREEMRAIRAAESARLAAAGDAGAEEARDRLEPVPSRDGPTRFFPLPEVVPAPAPGLASVPAGPAPAGRAEVKAARDRAAAALFALADRAAKVGRFALADECLRGVLARRPGHEEARRLLGYVPHADGWATPFAAKMLRDGWTLHPTFGWVEAGWVPHLDRGELPAPAEKGRPVRWLPAEDADALRRDFAAGWTIETAHFHIRTNVPLSEAIAFGRRLEDFHDAFFALLADVIGPNLPLAQRYRSPAPARPPTRRHRIWYFASKAEYVAYLRDKHGPGVEIELGRYDPGPASRPTAWGTSYFFRDPDAPIDANATLYHEASHQLLFESAGRWAYEKNAGHYWVFEGLGTYFETVTPRPDGSLEVGGLVGPRIEKARVNLLEEGRFIPIAELVAMDQAAFDDEHDVFLHYAESMALAVFLMQADGARHREPFLDYARDAYKGQLRRGRSLEGRLGIPLKALDREFLDFLKAGTSGGRPRPAKGASSWCPELGIRPRTA